MPFFKPFDDNDFPNTLLAILHIIFVYLEGHNSTELDFFTCKIDEG